MPFMHRRALPNPRSAPPAPCGTTSAAPTRKSGTPPPGSPASSAPGRTATGGRSPAGDTPGPRASAPASRLSMPLEPLGQRAAEDRLDRPVADGRHPRTVRPATDRHRRTPQRRAHLRARDRGPSSRQRRSGLLPSSDRGPGPPPLVVRLRRNIPSRRRPGPGPRVPHSRLSSSMPLHFSAAAHPPATPSPERIVQRADPVPRSSSPFGQLEAQWSWFRPPATRCVEGQAGPARFRPRCPCGRARRPRSPNKPPAAAAARRRRTGSCNPGTPPPPSRGAPETPPADAHSADAARSTPLHRQTHDLVLVRARRRLQPAEPAGRLVRSRRHRPGSVPWPPGVLEVDPEPAREPRNRSERQFQDRLGGRKSSVSAARPIRPMRTGRESARASPRTPTELGADPTSRSNVLRTPGPPARPTTSPAPAPGPAARRPASRSAPRPPAAAPRPPPRPPPARSPAAG